MLENERQIKSEEVFHEIPRTEITTDSLNKIFSNLYILKPKLVK